MKATIGFDDIVAMVRWSGQTSKNRIQVVTKQSHLILIHI